MQISPTQPGLTQITATIDTTVYSSGVGSAQSGSRIDLTGVNTLLHSV
jgi:hypothetical protein